MADGQPEETTTQRPNNCVTDDLNCEIRPSVVNPITRTVSDSAAYTKRDIQKESRTRSVTFYDNYCDRQKRKLQRTPTPYWPRKEVGLVDSFDGSSFDDENPYLDSPSGSSTCSPNVSFDESPASDSVRLSGPATRRSHFQKSPRGGVVLSIDEESDNELQHGGNRKLLVDSHRSSSAKDSIRYGRQQSGSFKKVTGSDISEKDLYRNPLFRRAAECHADPGHTQ